MSDYSKSTNFASKDNLSSGNPLKIVKGTEIDTEFNNIATAIATKQDYDSDLATWATKTAPSGTAVGTTDSQTLTNKTINIASNTVTVDGTNLVGYRNVPPVGTKTGSYTLTTADVGKYVQVGSGGSITIPNSTFAEGDIVSVFNNTSGTITITCTITTAYIAGLYTDKNSLTLAAAGVATILFISGTLCVVSGNVS